MVIICNKCNCAIAKDENRMSETDRDGVTRHWHNAPLRACYDNRSPKMDPRHISAVAGRTVYPIVAPQPIRS